MEWLIAIVLQQLLQSRPAISRNGNVLIARSGWKSQVLCLGFAGRKVTVDPNAKIVRITRRLFWFVHFGKVFTFERILCVLSDYRDLSFSNLSISGAYRDRGIYTVELRLVTGERIVLFRYFQEGAFNNEGFLPDFMFWEDHLDAWLTKTDQGSHVDSYARLVAALIGVSVHAD